MTDLNDIAGQLGWVAINAARLEHLVGILRYIMAGRQGAEQIFGAPWKENYRETKNAVQSRLAKATNDGDEEEIQQLSDFLTAFELINSMMLDRHHVLHAIWGLWTIDEQIAPGATLTLRRRGQTTQDRWPAARVDELRQELDLGRGLSIYSGQLLKNSG